MASPEEHLTVAAVARRLGVAPATLRTWDRRYGLGPSAHESGKHRRYCPADLARLTLMRRLITSGVSPADAAEQAKNHKGTMNVERIVHDYVVREELVGALHKAAKALDKKFIEAALRKDLAKYGVEQSWSEAIVPLLLLVGNEWEASGEGIEIEHLLTEVLKGLLREQVEEIRKPVNANPVLLASVGEELHSLALHALAAALAERKIETYFLGSRTPLEALSAMITRSAHPLSSYGRNFLKTLILSILMTSLLSDQCLEWCWVDRGGTTRSARTWPLLKIYHRPWLRLNVLWGSRSLEDLK